MSLPCAAIVGRPNVGKSSLFNLMAGRMISIVEPTAGVTRDRISTIVGYDDKYIELVDTGGYGIIDNDALDSHIYNQIQTAIDKADLIIFLFDIRDGITPLDSKIAELLRKTKINVIPVANKADSPKLFPQSGEFIKLGFGEPICISAKNNVNKDILLDRVFSYFADYTIEKPKDAVMHFTLVGKRNAGKSSFINAIVGQERVIVSEIPGTTRDAVDVRFEKDGQVYVAIDTAGVRKKKQMVNDDLEFYSYTRVQKSIRRADVVLFLIDASEPISQVDKKLAALVSQEYKSTILIVNKWDLAKDYATTDDYADYLEKVLPGMKYTPIAFTTAKEGKNIQAVLDLAKQLFKQANTKLPTNKINKAFEKIAQEKISPGHRKSGVPKIYYATQIAVNPVTFLLFVNRPDLFTENYQRFLLNKVRQLLPVDEVPIRLVIKPRTRGEEREQA